MKLTINAPENDWCMEEDKLTSWTGDKCNSCGRLWGMPTSSDLKAVKEARK